MAPKKATSAGPAASSKQSAAVSPHYLPDDVQKVWNGYWDITSHQTKLIDIFLAFLVLVGGLQMLYFLLGGRNVSSSHCPSLALTNKWTDRIGLDIHSLTMPSSPASLPPLANSP